ncbi:hypothetical protein Daus18300_008433 [Diaporthe australafricana]|uniref:Heterokaryon incompatibility domain-containing protein n=1 Tax=Diaporthe australafricana TaxID=127596 RepID=A0ABR3WIY8_9PEZI
MATGMSLNDKYSNIVEQLRKCESTHRACCSSWGPDPNISSDEVLSRPPRRFEERHGSNFRLVDVDRGCVSDASLDARYVALSYVSGSEGSSRADNALLGSVASDGSLQDIFPKLPRTVKDAIDLVRDIGERYLWVDALCIAHDDDDDIQRSLWISSSIWSGACITIVAASGDDADSGLELERPEASGQAMATVAEIEQEFSTSKYNTQGWTLQGLAFSRRILIFLNSGVYFRCVGSEQPGESDPIPITKRVEHLKAFNLSFQIPGPLDGVIPSLLAYRTLCEAYSLRKLSRDGDALRALAGALRTLLAGMKSPGVEGLPGYYLGYFQLFYSRHGNLRRRPGFASFSWAGWEGEVQWPRQDVDESEPVNLLRWLRDKPLVDWSALRPGAKLHHLSEVNLEEGSSPLEAFMRSLPHVFSPEKAQDNGHADDGMSSDGPFHNSSGWEFCSTSTWDEEIEAWHADERPVGIDGFPSEALDAANSKGEFEAILQRIDGDKYRKAEMKHRTFLDRGGIAGPKFRRDTKFRRSPAMQQGIPKVDRRAAKFRESKLAQGQELLEIPNFPPYTVLQAHAITLRLILGEAIITSSPHQPPHHARPLLSSSGEHTIGSLLPDNISLLPTQPGTPIDCIVVAHATADMEHSLLPSAPIQGDPTDDSSQGQGRLIWIMHVEWKDGIAERRGIGQMRVSGLAKAVAPGPTVRSVLLG